jgi:hypothetical protein
MSKKSRDKGNRTERAIVPMLQECGIKVKKISGMYRPGADIAVPLLGIDRAVEVKCWGDGFKSLYAWLNESDVLIVMADRLEPLVVVRPSLAAEVHVAAERGRR